MERQILAMGGDGLLGAAGLDGYLVGLARRTPARVLVVGTASGDHPAYALSLLGAFGSVAHVAFLPLFERDTTDLRRRVFEHDVVYVGGGNTANLLAVWRVHGLDVILREAWEAGIVLGGASAGAICWFEGGTTDSFGGMDALPDGLGLLAGSMSPHYDGEPKRRPTYQRLVADGALADGLAADDGVGLHFVGRELHAVVSERDGAHAYRVERDGDGVRETVLRAARV